MEGVEPAQPVNSGRVDGRQVPPTAASSARPSEPPDPESFRPHGRPLVSPAFSGPVTTEQRWRSRNIVHKLRMLQRYGARPNAHIPNTRTCYTSIYPNGTHFEIEDGPPVAIRKFSPCGRFLVTFSRSVHALHVYRLKRGGRSTKAHPTGLWSHFFEPHFITNISHGSSLLNKDFCLFSKGSKYILVASTEANPDAVERRRRRRRNPESLDLADVKDVSLYVVDMSSGTIMSRKEFPSDYINLTHNTGVYLYKDLLAVLSLQHQQVHLLRLTDDGELMDIKTIGEFCYEDDALFLSRTSAEGGQSDGWGAPNQEQADGTTPWSLSSILQPPEGMVFFNPHERPHQFISGLKHLLLVFLWKRARKAADSANALRYFHSHFEEYNSSLSIWKMQLLDEQHLLLKYGCVDHAGSRGVDSTGMLAFFVVYNFVDPQIVNVFENNQTDFLSVYKDCADYFRQSTFDTPVPMMSTPANSLWNRQHFQKTLHLVKTARNGGVEQSVRRGLGVLPCAAQNYRESPYFDMSLYSYDEKCISHTDRLKPMSEFPAKFYSRQHGGVTFRIQAGQEHPVRRAPRLKQLVNFMFHPYLPFAISVQHVIHQIGSTSSHTNLHYRP